MTGLHGDPLILGGDIVVVGLDRLGGGDGAQRQVEPNRLLRLRTQALDERVGVLTGRRQELFDVDTPAGELASGALYPATQVGVDESGRRLTSVSLVSSAVMRPINSLRERFNLVSARRA